MGPFKIFSDHIREKSESTFGYWDLDIGICGLSWLGSYIDKPIKRTILAALALLLFLLMLSVVLPAQTISIDKSQWRIYPDVNEKRPPYPSPFVDEDAEYVIAVTMDKKYAIIPVTLSNSRSICQQLVVDAGDFPTLARTGLHSIKELEATTSITGWPLAKIDSLAQPNALSSSGFVGKGERVLEVIKSDNATVARLGLTHPDLARPLFHVLNMVDTDLALNRWNMADHRWDNIVSFFYNGKEIYVEAEDTKGGQKSIFNDGITGGFYIRLWREISANEIGLLQRAYGSLNESDFDELKTLLREINTGEMEPQYIMRYGFYEGRTFWRTDPIAISFVFGLKSLEELESLWPGQLYDMLTKPFAAWPINYQQE